MTKRLDVVKLALKDNGYLDGNGYPGKQPNKYDHDLGIPQSYSCAAGCTYWLKHAGVHLPSMQQGMKEGFAFVPSGWAFARARKATRWSWQAQPADLAIFDWNGDGNADHVELVESWANGILHTIGADSGPSNVDHWRGEGGTHRHTWHAPSGQGNSLILGIIDTSKLVKFAK